MRKFKLFLSMLMLIAFSVGNVWAAEETYSMTPNAKTTGSSATSYQSSLSFTHDGVSWTMAQINPSTLQTKTNQSSASAEFNFHNTSAFPGRISKVVVTYKALTISTGKESEFKFVGGTSEVTNLSGGDAATWNSTAKTMTWTPASTTNYTYFAYYMNGKTATGSNYLAEADAIVVTYEGSGGSCTNEITITKADNPEEGLFTIDKSGKVCIDEGNATVNVTATPNTGYHLATVTSTVGTVGSIDGNTCEITGINDNTTISVTFAENPKYTVSFNTGEGNPGVDPITETTAGAGITLPAGPTPACSAAGWSFAGWAAAAVASETTTAPTFLSGNYKPTENVTLYAVYKRTEGGGDGAAVGTTLFSENFGTFSADSVPNGETSATTGRVIYGGGSVTYTSADNGSNLTKIYNDALAGGTAPELLVGKSGGVFRIAGIPSGKADKIGVSFKQNAQKLTVSLTGTGYSTTYASPKPTAAGEVSFDINVADGADETFAIVLTAGSSNVRVDDISITVASSSTAGTNYYLSAPSCCTKHNVNIALGIENGTVKADLAEACVGTEVTLTATPDVHCAFVAWDVKQGETPITVTGDKFIMPDGDVTVSATFAEIRHAANVLNPGHGVITVTGADNLESVLEGTELTASASGAGYEFTLKAYKSGDETTVVPITDGKLIMPAYDIVITADEAELVSPTIIVSQDIIDFGSVTKGASAPAALTFTISGANLTGDLSLAWETSDGYFEWAVTEGSLTADAGIVAATVSIHATETAMNSAGTLMDNLIVSGGSATQKEVTVGIVVKPTYTAKWFVNGVELTAAQQQAVAGTALITPVDPEATGDCAGLVFRGWITEALAEAQDVAPAFVTDFNMPNEDVNFYAVFATAGESDPIKTVDNIDNTFTGVTGTSYTPWSGKVGLSGAVYAGSTAGGHSSVQMRSSKDADGLIMTATGSGKVTKITVKWNSNTAATRTIEIYGKNTAYESASDLYGANAGTSLGTLNIDDAIESVSELSVKGDYPFIGIRSQEGALYLDNIAIEWTTPGPTVYSGHLTSCPICKVVNLSATDVEHGAIALKVDGVSATSVETCHGPVVVDVVASPDYGYSLANVELSGVAGATYADGKITIPADVEGTLTATASFSLLTYDVTMAQTGDAGAIISANQYDKHVNDVITISTNLPEGYIFLGWEANVAVAFADKFDLTTTFTMPAGDVLVTARFGVYYSPEVVYSLSVDVNNIAVIGIVSEITEINTTYHNATYHISTDGTDVHSVKIYRGKYIDGADFVSEDQLHVGDKVLVYGDFDEGAIYGSELINSKIIKIATLLSQEIVGDPAKTEYWRKEYFDPTGLSAVAHYSDGTNITLVNKNLGFTGGKLMAGTTYVNVYTNWLGNLVSRDIDITVLTIANDIEHPYSVTEALALYEQGKDLDVSVYVRGRICQDCLAEFNSSESYFNLTVEDPDATDNKLYLYHLLKNDGDFESRNDLTEGDIIVMNGTLDMYASLVELNVCFLYSRTAAEVTAVAITDATPDKTTYIVDDAFDFAGMGATAYYNTGFSRTVTPIWAADPAVLAYGNTTVNVTATFSGVTSDPVAVDVTVNRKEASLSWSQTELTVALDDWDGFLHLNHPDIDKSEISFESTNPNVVEMRNGGNTHGDYVRWAVGEATLTANFPGNDVYAPAVATCHITVTKGTWQEILFKDLAGTGSLNGVKISADDSEFGVTITDTDKSKLSITDDSSAKFGTLSTYKQYFHRLKTSGKSSTNNHLEINIPDNGVLRLAVRSASSGAYDRTLVLTQNEVELYNAIVKDEDVVIDPENEEKKVYPYVTVPVKEGTVDVTYPVGGLNFYGMNFLLNPKHTVSYETPEHGSLVVKKGDNIIASGSELTEGSLLSFVATPADGYRLVNITVNGSIFDEEFYQIEDDNIVVSATFEPIPNIMVYFVNKDNWDAVFIHLWNAAEATTKTTSWPGIEVTNKLEEKINGYDVYSYSIDPALDYDMCIFNNGDNGLQTADLTIEDGKYYYGDGWYSYGDIPVLRLENGFYLIGQYGFDVENIPADLKFIGPDETGQYKLDDVELTQGQTLKVVYVKDDAIATWFPGGETPNYEVDNDHKGTTDIYFRPDGNGNDDWFYRFFYVLPTSSTGTAIDNTADEKNAVKVLRNDVIYIIKGGKTYNITGQRVK